ncbi:MAG: hypothetical protein EPN82_05900 [Bacteroidetes bacterium]|nr:MAG: hypothetical protein EPN82_05900 [Bacteroidota bacterium]
MKPVIAFITYETPWTPAGGIASVMKYLPDSIQKLSNIPTVIISPYHKNILKDPTLFIKVESINVQFDNTSIEVGIQKKISGTDKTDKCEWLFLKPESDITFFDGNPHPYLVNEPDDLVRDSLFFGESVVKSLSIVKNSKIIVESTLTIINNDPEVYWYLLMQDYEAVTTAFYFVRQGDHHGRLYLTLHNSYDKYTKQQILNIFNIFSPAKDEESTILNRAISLVESPIITVSDQFALDLNNDIFQNKIMAPHLQKLLEQKKIIGINNGPFAKIDVELERYLEEARKGNFNELHKWKEGKKKVALDLLEKIKRDNAGPVWGNVEIFGRKDSPWFIMSGRDDPNQKGYDLAELAIRRFFENNGDVDPRPKFLFFPVPGDEGLEGLRFLENLTSEFPEDVIVVPFIWKDGYFTCLLGSSFGLMPSLYEPFGSANEFYLRGCLGIGRATGGLLEQIVPYRSARSFSHAVMERSKRYYSFADKPTGILFREKDNIITAVEDWHKINKANYTERGITRVEERQHIPLVKEMIKEFCYAIEDGINIYNSPDLYYKMLIDGIEYITNSFSWKRTAQEYIRYLHNIGV